MTNEGTKSKASAVSSSSSSSPSPHHHPNDGAQSSGGPRRGTGSSSGRGGRGSGGRGSGGRGGRGSGGRGGRKGGRGGGAGRGGGGGSGSRERNADVSGKTTSAATSAANNGTASGSAGSRHTDEGPGAPGRGGRGSGGRGGRGGSSKSRGGRGGPPGRSSGGRGGRGGGKNSHSHSRSHAKDGHTHVKDGRGSRDRSDSVATDGSGKSGSPKRSGKGTRRGGHGKNKRGGPGQQRGHSKQQQPPHADADADAAHTAGATTGAPGGSDDKLFASPTLDAQHPPRPGQRGVLSLPTGFTLPPLSPSQLAPTTYEEHSAAVLSSSPLRPASGSALAHSSPGRSPKPIYKRFDSHEDDFYSGEFRAERADEMHEEQHLAERMAAMVVDSDDDDDDDDNGIADFGDLGGGPGLLRGEEEKKDESAAVGVGGIGGGIGGRGGLAPTSRFAAAAANLSKDAEEANAAAVVAEAEAAATATEEGDGESATKKKKKNKRGKKKKAKGDGEGEEGDHDAEAKAAAEPEPPKPITTTEAIGKLKQQEVSIGTSTTVQMRRNDSALSLANSDGATGAFDADGQPVINLLQKEDDAKKGGKGGKKDKKKKGKGRSKALGGNEAENQRAARRFNRSVRGCVENSDAAGLADLLRDKRNHNFALEPSVLETVMKAYVVAAMFEDALYCLRNCALPGTLKIGQTERILTCLPQNLRNSSAFTAADMINQLCIATEFDLPTHRTYFMRLCRGIALEFLEEVTSARDRICSAPCERLVRSQVCVVDAKLRRGKKATELVVDPGHQLGVFIPEGSENRGIQAGDAVGILPYAGPYPMSAESLDRNMIEATVGSINGAGNLVLRLQDKTNTRLYTLLTENSDGNVYRIDKLANRMGFNRQLASAVSICAPKEALKDARRPSRELIKAITAMDENIEHRMLTGGNVGRRNSSDELTSTAALCADAVPFYSADEKHDDDEDDNKADNADAIRAAARLALEKYGAFEGLNSSQRLAVEGAATNRLTLVQGPPGTGKTAVAIRILKHWARLAASEAEGSGKPANPILATSDSNIAVDNLVEGCANVGLRVIRLGRPEAIRPELLRYCIDRPGGDERGGRGGGMSARDFKEKAKAIKNAQVICCTCIGSGSDIIDSVTFERVLVDEATQATEPAVLVPLARGCRQLVLVGDHCQLPPTVLSTRAEEEGLGVPLFSRMVACGVPPFMLDTQYRMHPAISMFCSDLFYGGKLLDGVSPPERRPLAGFPWPREEFPVAFVPVNHGIEMDDGVSKLNEAEAAAACDAVSALIDGGCPPSEIAVVTPYAAQVRLIRRLTRKLLGQRGPPFVEVSSTDGFQGREKEAVVFSAVRSNDYGAVGFVSDWRRVNVSFTRARRALIVIGNDHTLRRGDPDTWAPWLQWADAHGLNMDNPGRPRGRYDPDQLRKVRGGTTAAEMLKDVLARQQAQTKAAERQLEKAEKNAAGHIMGTTGGDDDSTGGGDGTGGADGSGPKTLQEDLAALANEDGCWDDSDDDDEIDGQILSPSISRTTLATSVSGGEGEEDDPEDAWDL